MWCLEDSRRDGRRWREQWGWVSNIYCAPPFIAVGHLFDKLWHVIKDFYMPKVFTDRDVHSVSCGVPQLVHGTSLWLKKVTKVPVGYGGHEFVPVMKKLPPFYQDDHV